MLTNLTVIMSNIIPNEIYISTDIETDGPIPGPHSMLSLASAAYLPDKTLISTFSANLRTLPDASGHHSTMEWWKKNPQAWHRSRQNLQDPEEVMLSYFTWIKNLPGIPVFIAYPACFDFLFVYWYLIRFVGASPFSFSALDIKSYAMAMLKLEYRRCTKEGMPKRWFDDLPHNHTALNDALEQGVLFCNMLMENMNRRE